jgi:hypothetical protein
MIQLNPVYCYQWAHYVCVAALFKDAGADKNPFFQRGFGLVVQSFGGGILASILLGQPASLFCSTYTLFNFAIACFFVFHVPFVHRIAKLPLIWAIVQLLDAVYATFSLTQGGVNRALTSAHAGMLNGAPYLLILCGILASIGGRCVCVCVCVCVFALLCLPKTLEWGLT